MRRDYPAFRAAHNEDLVSNILIIVSVIALMLFVGGLVILFSSRPSDASIQATVESPAQPAVKIVNVLVPIQEVEIGRAIEPTMFRIESRPVLAVGPTAVASYDEIKGTYSKQLIIPGVPLTREQITLQRPTNILTAMVKPGYRAVTISTNATSSVEGWAKAGAKVDVSWVTRINGRQGIIPIVQNAEVLSAEGQLQNAPKDKNQQGVAIPSTVTLHVPAQEALKIILAASNGSVTLSLRSDNDSKQGTAGKPITERELLGANGLDVPSTFVKPEISVGIRGSNGKVEQFDLSDGRLIKKTEPAKPDIEWVAAN